MSELPVLDATEQRVLGSLMEKQTTVPSTYPLTANALRTACNQTSSREPVTDLDQQTVEATARALKDRGLLRIVWADRGPRTLKYHQRLDEVLGLADDERALLTVLLLRGEQAPGELRTRTDRLHAFGDRRDVEECLARMAARPEPLVRELPRRVGQHDARWIHLLGPVTEGESAEPGTADAAGVVAAFWEACEARDWERFAATLAEDVVYENPQTRERVRGREAYTRFNREFPGPWHLRVTRLVASDQEVSTVIDFELDGTHQDGITFFRLTGSEIVHVLDYWPEPYEPPAGREHLVERY